MQSRLLLTCLSAISILAFIAGLIWYFSLHKIPLVENFEDCVAAGYPILESYPARCITTDGKSFTQNIGNELEKADLIHVASPRPGTTVTGPLMISGEARGSWFFEASFPVYLEDPSGTRVATAIAAAQGEWMTTEFVPFQTKLTIPTAFSGPATLVFAKDNPSGLPEHDDALRIPIIIEKNSAKNLPPAAPNHILD